MAHKEYRCLLVGNANSGKSTLFNSLTGLNQKTGNFQGVTVEKHSGTIYHESDSLELVDLPGSFSLNGFSEDKKVLSRFLMNRLPSDRIIFIMDPIQIERSMQFFLQIADLGAPILLVLTMKDVLEKRKLSIQLSQLEKSIRTKVFLVNAKKKEDVLELKKSIMQENSFSIPGRLWKWDAPREELIESILQNLDLGNSQSIPFLLNNSLKQLSGESLQKELPGLDVFPKKTREWIEKKFQSSNVKFTYQDELIYKAIQIKSILAEVINFNLSKLDRSPISLKLDHIFLHPVWGILSFLFFMGLMFQALFSWSEIPMKWIESFIDLFSNYVKTNFQPGPLNGLVSTGIIGGVGAVLVFIPQITFLFLFIGLMEESGYMARASFLMDKFMGRFGLSGKSFVPLLSSAACAVPGILSSRTIEDKTDRIITILVSPLITCSARYPVYILVIGTVFPATNLLGFISLRGAILFTLFMLGISTAMVMALIFKKTYFRSDSSYFILELPEYKIPSMKSLFFNLYQKIKAFVINAGTIILYISVVLWFLVNYPNKNLDESKPYSPPPIDESYAGKFGAWMEPAIKPLGFDWKIGVSILTSFAAREVMVSTLSIIYEVEGGDENNPNLRDALKKDLDKTGKPIWTTSTGWSILIFFAFASQCMSTLAVVRKETNSYILPIFLFSYMSVLAYVSSFIIYHLTN